MARSAVCMSCCAHRNILMNLVLSCLRRLVESRRLMAEETIPSRLPLLSLMWKRLLRDLVRAPDSLSCPEEALASKLAQEGFLFLWVVLSCPVRLFSHGGRSCLVLFVCLALEGYPVLSCVSSPGGLLIPPNFPREFLFGGKRVPAVGAGPRGLRPRRRRRSAMASWAPSSAMVSRAPSSAMASFVCSALEVPILCSCPCLSWGASRAPPTPPPWWNCYGVGHAFREGGVMLVLCLVFPPHVCLFGLFPVLV